jgi:L-serine dehydratase
VLVEFDRQGSLATTYEGQGSAMGLISGLLGLSILDRDMVRYRELALERNLDITFNITDLLHRHPNTYSITVEAVNGERFSFVAVSTGGGMIEFIEINGYRLSVKGDFFETLVCFGSAPEVNIDKLQDDFKKLSGISEVNVHTGNAGGCLIEIKSREALPAETEALAESIGKASWMKRTDPVMPVIGGVKEKLPFTSISEMLALADTGQADLRGSAIAYESARERTSPGEMPARPGIKPDLADLAIAYESARAGISPSKVVEMMSEIVSFVRTSVSEGLKGTVYTDRILGRQSHLILEAERERRIFETPMNRITAYVTALMESKSSMGIIVAAPTAGSSGVLGGTILGLAEGASYSREDLARAFLAAGLVGVFIAGKYTFAAEEGGCQVECGAASGMTAAGLVTLMGGTARQAADAASMALQNMLGLICDPVADRVEVPCLGKNILAAANAMNSANMSMAGFDSVIPLDEVIDAMKSVGEALPSSLCCTGLGGLSITPTALKIQENLKLNNPAN